MPLAEAGNKGHRKHVLLAFLLAWSSLISAGCARIFIAGGPSVDSGTFDVSGVKTGAGGQLEVGFQANGDGSGFGGYLSSGLIGYSSPGDGDPIYQTLLEARYRQVWGQPTKEMRPFYSLGIGSGVFYVAGPRGAAVTMHSELGVELRTGSTTLALCVRERPALFLSGSPDFLNSLQVFLGLGFPLKQR
jgi:hypothetical protein